MRKRLIMLALITAFGRNSRTPLKKAYLTLLTAVATLSFSGVLLSQAISHANLAQDIPPRLIFVIISVIVFAIMGFVLLPMVNITDGDDSPAIRVMSTLPVSRFWLWALRIFPLFVTCLLCVCFFAPILLALHSSVHANIGLLIVGYSLGNLAAAGFSMAGLIRVGFIKHITYISLLISQFYLLDVVITNQNDFIRFYSLGLIVVSLVMCALGIVQSFFYGGYLGSSLATRIYKLRLPLMITNNFWFAIKFLRNRKTYSSFVFCLLASSAILISGKLRHTNVVPAPLALLFAGILSGALACDARGISRRMAPPEVTGLRGHVYFVDSQARALLLLGCIVALPVVLRVVMNHPVDPVRQVVFGLSLVVAAMTLGLLSSTIFVPSRGELGSQFVTGMLTIAGFMTLPKLLKFANLGIGLQTLSWFCVAGACFLATLLIEENRRRHYGRA